MIQAQAASQQWFRSQVWLKRMGVSVGMIVGFSSILTLSMTGILSLSLSSTFNPFNWIVDGLLAAISFKSIVLTVLSSFLLAVASSIYPKILTVHPRQIMDCLKQRTSPLLLFWDLGLNGSFLVVSLVTSYYILEASDSSYKLQTEKTSGEDILSVGHCLIMFSMLVTHIWALYDYFNTLAYTIPFEPITRPLVTAVKSDLPLLMKDAAWRALFILKISILLLPIFGVRLLGPFVAFGVEIPPILRILRSLCDLKLIATALILVFRAQVVWSLTHKAFHWLLHRPVTFPVPSPHYNASSSSYMDPLTETPYLHVALESHFDVILKHYGFWDLSRLSQNCYRRAQIYAVSTPGGHPRNWNAIFGICLNELGRLKEEMDKQNGRLCGAVDSGIVQHQVSKPDRDTLLQPKQISILEKEKSRSSIGPLRERKQAVGGTSLNNRSWENRYVPQQNKSTIVNFLAKVRVLGQGKPAGKLQSAAAVFKDSQLHIWTVEAVSFLVYYSYEEDKLGIVQKDLSAAFGIILDLQSAVERFCRLSGMHHQFFPGMSGQSSKHLEALVIGLRQTLHSAVYRIHQRFSPHLDAIKLTSNQRIWLDSQRF